MMKLGLLGNKITHSLSPLIFERLFDLHEVQGSYTLFERNEFRAEALIDFFSLHELSGLNVTMPFKSDFTHSLKTIHPSAQLIGAVNTIVLENGELVGYNTDYHGIQKSLSVLGNPPKSALVFGNGGASKAVQKVLQDMDISFSVVGRSTGDYTFKSLPDDVAAQSKWWINCTPVGSEGNSEDLLPLPFGILNKEFAIFDLVYKPTITPLMKKGLIAGAAVLGGELMLTEQAKKAWDYFQAAYYNNM